MSALDTSNIERCIGSTMLERRHAEAARAELSALRAALERCEGERDDARLMLAIAGNPGMYRSLRRRDRRTWKLVIQMPNDDDGCATTFKLCADANGIPELTDSARTALAQLATEPKEAR